MTFIQAVHFIPDSLEGWLIAAAALATIAGVIVGSIMFVMKKMLEANKAESTGQLQAIEVKIDGIRINQQENTDATLRAVSRVQELEIVINNGLTHRAEETRLDVEAIKANQVRIGQQMSEVHGWMKAMHDWDGSDRRS